MSCAPPATLPTPSDLAVMLPNTGPESARAAESRALEVLPDAKVGLTVYEHGEVPDLLGRARSAAGEDP